MSLKIAATGVGVFLGLCLFAAAQDVPPMPSEELPPGAEELTTGPVHEAFAAPVTLENQAGVMAPKAPPAPIAEVPPSQRPQDPNMAWAPGYWGWDGNRNDYIWVSGCWRVSPPGMCWVPGYWAEVAGGYEWVAGFWKACAEGQQVEYLPAPPAPIEVIAPGPPPTADQVWVPGCWYRDQGQYVQRHGYWLRPKAGWIWTPSYYSWSPRGYIFCSGHWDYDLDRRGVLFTPVYFPSAVTVEAGFEFSPSICVDLGALRINLFTYPRYSHYYFGDCYDDSFLNIGIYPWFEGERHHTWYDPIFQYERWNSHGKAGEWEARERSDYDARRANPRLRPAKTFAEQQVRMAHMSDARRKTYQVAEPLRTFAAERKSPMKFEELKPVDRQKIAVKANTVQNFRQQRTQWEGPKGAATVVPGAERKGPEATTPPRETTAPARRPVETKAPAETRKPVETKAPAETRKPAETKAPVETRKPAETKAPVETPRPPVPAVVPPHEVRVTAPERETIPQSPITHQPVKGASPRMTAPERPSAERNPQAAPDGTTNDGTTTDNKGSGKGRGR